MGGNFDRNYDRQKFDSRAVFQPTGGSDEGNLYSASVTHHSPCGANHGNLMALLAYGPLSPQTQLEGWSYDKEGDYGPQHVPQLLRGSMVNTEGKEEKIS